MLISILTAVSRFVNPATRRKVPIHPFTITRVFCAHHDIICCMHSTRIAVQSIESLGLIPWHVRLTTGCCGSCGQICMYLTMKRVSRAFDSCCCCYPLTRYEWRTIDRNAQSKSRKTRMWVQRANIVTVWSPIVPCVSHHKYRQTRRGQFKAKPGEFSPCLVGYAVSRKFVTPARAF